VELINTFEVAIPPATAWEVLTDLERIAPCMPGATLGAVEGDEFHGSVKVKVGPITSTYKGTATFIERDQGAGVAVIKAQGRDSRGQGTASATITARLVGKGTGTEVTVVTDLTITGKVAQFGRGVLADVGSSLLDQFVARLDADVLATLTEGPDGASPIATPRAAADPPAVSLLSIVGPAILRRVGVAAAALAVVGWVVHLVRRRGGRVG
jgi:carbon monoxide dehydrogenase subunit G